MNKEILKVIPDCIEKIGKITPAKHRDIRKTLICILPFSVLGGMIYSIYKERIADKGYEETILQHEEKILQMEYEHKEKILQMEYEHEEKMEEIKTNRLIRARESDINEKDN